jgi:hypothetical protein
LERNEVTHTVTFVGPCGGNIEETVYGVIVYLCNSGVGKESNAEKQIERWYASTTPMALTYAFGIYYLCNPVYKRGCN